MQKIRRKLLGVLVSPAPLFTTLPSSLWLLLAATFFTKNVNYEETETQSMARSFLLTAFYKSITAFRIFGLCTRNL
jgi:hypothetical protein